MEGIGLGGDREENTGGERRGTRGSGDSVMMMDGARMRAEREGRGRRGLAGRSGHCAQTRTREEKRRADFGGVLESDRA